MLEYTPTLQLLSSNDAKMYLDFLNVLDAESPYMHYLPGERKMTEQGMRSRIKKMTAQGNSFVVLALGLDGNIIGYFSVNGGSSERTKHSAVVAVGVLSKYRGNGIATELLERAYSESLNCGVVRWECTVVMQNTVAVNFYYQLGFDIRGVLRNRFETETGVCDELILEYMLI